MDRAAIPRGLKILVLEDDRMVSQLLNDMLLHAGCTVVGLFATAAEALAAIARRPPQVALLDVHLGNGENAYAVAEALAARGVPFAFVTGDGAARPPASFRERPLLVKPFHLAVLVRLVGELARQAAKD